MDKNGIFEFLKNEGFVDVSKMNYDEDIVVFKFLYEFNKPELDAAKEYADENYDEDNGEDEWYEEYYMPYLTDTAADNIRDIFDDIREEFEVDGDFIIYEMERENTDGCEVVMAFANMEAEINLDDIIEDLNL